MSESLIHVRIATLERLLYTGTVREIIVPAVDGQITLLPGHEPMITRVVAGELRLKVAYGEGIFDPEWIYIAVSGAFVEVLPDSQVNIIAESALRIAEIDEGKAMEAKSRAEELMKNYLQNQRLYSEQEFTGAAAQLAKALAELKVVQRRRKR